MKKILLPTDFSENSMNAINYAMRFFENWECHFYILNVQKTSEFVIDDLMSASPGDSVYGSIATDNKKLIQQLVKKLNKQHASKSYTFHGLFDYDDLVSAVDQAVESHQIDLIIMGTNGATGAKEVVFGSNTLRVIRDTSCPILTIPENYSFHTLKNALFSTQDSNDFSFEGMELFKELLQLHQCQLNVLELHDNMDVTKTDSDCVKALFPEHPYTYYNLHTSIGLEAVNIVTQLLKIDIHAVYIERKNFMERLLLGSKTSKLTYNTSVPMLLLHR